MDRKTELRIAIFGVSLLTVFLLLALYTDNPRQGTPNQDSYVEQCKPYFLNGVQCPLDKNQNNSSVSKADTTTVNQSEANG